MKTVYIVCLYRFLCDVVKSVRGNLRTWSGTQKVALVSPKTT